MTTRRAAASSNIIFLILIAVSIGVIIFARGNSAGDTAPSDTLFTAAATYEDASQAAANEGKLVLVLATADWCGPCVAFRSGTLADPAIQQQISSIAVPYKLDVTNQSLPAHDAKLAADLGVMSIPALFVIDGQDTVLASTVGNLSTDDMSKWLQAAEAASNTAPTPAD